MRVRVRARVRLRGRSWSGSKGLRQMVGYLHRNGVTVHVSGNPGHADALGSRIVRDLTPGSGYSWDEVMGKNPKVLQSGRTQRATYEDMTTDLRAKLAEIKTPVTMLYPWDASAGLPVAAVDGLYQENFAALPNKKLVRIDDSRHFIMLDQSAAFMAQVDAFLK